MFNNQKPRVFNRGFFFSVFLTLFFGTSVFAGYKSFENWLFFDEINQIRQDNKAELGVGVKNAVGVGSGKVKGVSSEPKSKSGQVKAVSDNIEDNSLVFRIKTFFVEAVELASLIIANDLTVSGDVVLESDLDVTGSIITGGTVAATNLVYSIIAGDGITVAGTQDITVTNDDAGSAQNIFGKIKAGDDTLSASSNTDTLILTAGTGMSISGSGKEVTIDANAGDLNISGWTDGGTVVALSTSTDNVGIGTTTSSTKLTVAGTTTLGGATTVSTGGLTVTAGGVVISAGGADITGGINNNSGDITNAGSITGATGLTSSGTITFSNLSTGLVHSNVNGVLSSSAINLAGGSTEVTGTLPVINGGTGLTSLATGDIFYASATDVLSKLGAGSEGEVLTMSSGIPDWGTSGAGAPCATCLVDNPASTQTITPTGTSTTGLIVKQASGGLVDIFSVKDNAGTTTYFKVDSSGNVVFGTGNATAAFTISPASTDPISISPVAQGAGAFTGTITSADISADRTWTFPDSTGIICLSGGNCSGTVAAIGGSGNANYLAKYDGTYSITDSLIYDDGTDVGIGTTNPLFKLDVRGTLQSTGAVTFGDDLSLAAHATISGSLRTDQAVDFNLTMGVAGATTLGSTLGVTGQGTFDSGLTVAGSVGIGDTTPDHKLDVAGNIGLDADSYINYGDTDGSSGYGLRDNSGTIEHKDSGGSWGAFVDGMSYTSVSTATTMAGNTGYITTHDSTAVILTLPASPTVGDIVTVTGEGDAGWIIKSNASDTSQKIITQSLTSAVSSSSSVILYSSGDDWDSVKLVNVVSGTDDVWAVVSKVGGSLSSANYYGDGSDGDVTISSSTSISNTQDGSMTVMNYSSLTIDQGYTLTTQNRSKGLLIYVQGNAVINGTVSMTARGASVNPVTAGVSASGIRLPMLTPAGSSTLSAADFAGAGSAAITAVANQPAISGDGTIFTAVRTGGAGGGGTISNGSGGGGNGAGINDGGIGGSGGAGTVFSGGSGGGGGSFRTGGNGGSTGGAGGDGDSHYATTAGGGAGNPGGGGDLGGASGATGTGGLLWLVVGGNLTIGDNGVVSANGANGGAGQAGGGASGGGRIFVLYDGTLLNTGTVQVNAGSGGSSGGGNGGAGKSTIAEVGSGGADLAEWMKVGDSSLDENGKTTLNPGDLLCIDTTDSQKVVACDDSYSQQMISVVTTAPGLVLGQEAEGVDAVKVVLTGRAPVKVTTSNGSIKAGDPITSSSITGVGMKATSHGQIIGYALEGYDGEGEGSVMVFVNPNWFQGNISKLNIDNLGNITIPGSIYQTADQSLFENIKPLESSLSKLAQLNVFSYNTLEDEKTKLGLSTEDIRSMFPEVVNQSDTNGLLGIDYTQLLSPVIQAINELSGMITNNSESKFDLSSFIKIDDDLEESIVSTDSSTLILGSTDETVEDNLIAHATISERVLHFLSEIIFSAKTEFQAGVEFIQEVAFKGPVRFNADTVGKFVVPEGVTKIKVEFENSFEEIPVVYASLESMVDGNYSLEDITKDGFTMRFAQGQEEEVLVNWLAVLTAGDSKANTEVLEKVESLMESKETFESADVQIQPAIEIEPEEASESADVPVEVIDIESELESGDSADFPTVE